MSYTPININIFQAAFAGALAGMAASNAANAAASAALSTYTTPASAALAFAEEADQIWNSTSNTSGDVAAIQLAAVSAFQQRTPNTIFTAAQMANTAGAIIAAVKEGDAVLAAAGVTPSTGGGGNYAQLVNAPLHSQTAGGNNAVIAAVAIQCQGSGIIRADVSARWITGTTAENNELLAVVVPYTAPASALFSSGGTMLQTDLFVANNILAPSAQLVAALAPYGAWLNSDANNVVANGILFNGVAPNGAASGAIAIGFGGLYPSLTGLLTGSGAGSNTALNVTAGSAYVSKSQNPKVAFPVGTWVVLSLVHNGTGGVDTFDGASLRIEEVSSATA